MRRPEFPEFRRVVAADRDAVADECLDLRQRLDVLLAAEADRIARRARPRGAPDAVHVVLRVLRHVVVEHVAYVRDVQAARRDVGRDERGQLAVVELAQHAHALALRHVARHRRGHDAVRAQQAFEPLGEALGVDEYERAGGRALAQQVDEKRRLLLHRRVVDHLAHALGRDALGLDADQLRVVHVLVGELEHAVRERRREQQVEAVLRRRQPAQQEPDVLDEAEVEHAVGLVEDHHLDVPQVEDVLAEEVDRAARRADQDVDARRERAALLVVVDAAEGEAERKPGVLREYLRVAMDLDRELARGREHERARRGGRPVRGCRVAQQVREECDQECGGLAGAGLGLARDVEARERTWQGLGLDRRAALETRVGDAAGDGFRQVQAGKGKVRELLMCQRITTLGVIT